MPPRPGLAARRFYRSFYYWTVLTTENTSTVGRHCFHTAPCAKEESHEASRPRIRKLFLSQKVNSGSNNGGSSGQGVGGGGSGQGGGGGGGGQGGGRRSGNGNGQQGSGHNSGNNSGRANLTDSTVPKHFKESAVLSTSQKPFGSFKPGERIVRYRSPEALMLELALPSFALEKARAKWGTDLQRLAEHYGARVDVQNISAPIKDSPNERIHSLLISGTFAQADRVTNFLLSFMPSPLSVIHPRETAPSSTMFPKNFLLRARDGSQVIGEFSMLEEQCKSILHNQDWARTALSSGVAMEVGLPELRPMSKDSNATALARSIMLTGSEDNVFRMRAMLFRACSLGGRRTTSMTNNGDSTSPAKMASSLASPGSRQPASRSPEDAPTSMKNAVNVEYASTAYPPMSESDSLHQNIENMAHSATHDQPIRCVIRIGGTDALRPDFVDAVWGRLEPPSSDVRVFRSDISRDNIKYEWMIEVLGPASAANAARKQIREVIAEAGRRMSLKALHIREDTTVQYRYMLTVAGKDVAINRDQILESMSMGQMRKEYSMSHRTERYVADGGIWRLRLAVKPEFIDQIRERVSKSAREFGERSGATAFNTTLRLYTLPVKLPTAASMKNSDTKDTTHSEPDTAEASLASAKTKEALIQVEKRSFGEQAGITEKPSGMQTFRAGVIAPLARTPEQQRQLNEDVRISLRSLTHPVVLITTRSTAETVKLSPEESARGVTVSSFSAVTLNPRPVVSFNLKIPSRSWDAMCQSRKLRVHLLEASSRGAAVAQVFTKPYDRPEMGFEELHKLGVQVQVDQSYEAPVISDTSGLVLAHFEADLLSDKCVTVGDHVVVLAEVTSVVTHVRGHGDADGLAYARRQYRASGEEVTPVEVPSTIEGGPDDPLTLAAGEPSPQPFVPVGKDIPANETPDTHASFNMDHDPIYNALRATKDAAESGKNVDIYAAMAMETESLGDESWPGEAKASSNPSNSKNYSRKDDGMPAGASPVEQSGKAHSSQPRSITRPLGKPLSRPIQDGAPPQVNGGTAKSYSTLSSPSNERRISTMVSSLPSIRCFSSAATRHLETKDMNDLDLVEPGVKSNTVADFLGVPDDNKRPHTPRVRSLLRLKKDIRRAERRLEREVMSDEEAVALQDSVAQSERIITRKLAWNAASDLRLMLDKGSARVNFKRAQWMESAVENGLKLLLKDARSLRQKREDGEMDAEQYDMLRQKLESDHGVLQTELMRLREVAEEDQEGGD